MRQATKAIQLAAVNNYYHKETSNKSRKVKLCEPGLC